jgi:putative addiction module component (TIGR02574 family)
MNIQEIEAKALQLPLEQRAALVRHLLASLEEADEFERAWAEEAARRFTELKEGGIEAIPAADVFAEARRASS